MSERQWFTAAEAAATMRLTMTALYVTAHREGWRRAKVGGRLRYAAPDVIATAEAREARAEVSSR